MILCRRDKKGIEDLITNTLVTRRKRWENLVNKKQ
jgi:hypothetical protein